jgi:predicted nucleic acid-binding Zn ribbon protein
MPFCPDCGTEVSEDTRFCPECGRPLVIEQAAKGKSKKKLAGIIAACIVATIVIVVIATRPPTSVEPEPAIPAHYTTYTDDLGLFSISYPPEWELNLESIEEIEQFSQEIIGSITSDIPLEDDHIIFMAGLPITGGYIPNVNIVVEPVHGIMWTHDQIVAAGIEALEAIASDYHEFSRVKTTIDNRTATIVECEVTVAGLGTFHYVFMVCIVNKTAWTVTCTALPDEYSECEDDFDAIVRSLRILK